MEGDKVFLMASPGIQDVYVQFRDDSTFEGVLVVSDSFGWLGHCPHPAAGSRLLMELGVRGFADYRRYANPKAMHLTAAGKRQELMMRVVTRRLSDLDAIDARYALVLRAPITGEPYLAHSPTTTGYWAVAELRDYLTSVRVPPLARSARV